MKDKVVCAASPEVLLTFGVASRHGDKHTPSIIRMGMNVHHSVASVSMETLVERRLEATKDSRVCPACPAHAFELLLLSCPVQDHPDSACAAMP